MRDGYKIVESFATPEQAHIARSALESAGIECFVANENIVSVDFFWSQAVGGVQLHVREADAIRAREILSTQALPAGGDWFAFLDEVVMCRNCGSRKVRYIKEPKPLTRALFFLGVPLPFFRKTWRCSSCGHEWTQEEKHVA